MRIALLVPTLELGGAERNVVQVGEALVDAGIDAEVWLTSADRRELTTRLRVIATGGPGSATPNPALEILRRIRRIGRHIRRFQPDCLISFLESSSIPAILAGMSARVPTIVSIRGNPERFNWFYRMMVFIFYRHARCVVLPSSEIAALLAKRYLLRNAVCIPNMLTSDPSEGPRNKQTGPMIAIGRLVRGKRFDEVIALAERLALGADLLVIGDGPERPELEARAARSTVKVRFAGSLPHEQVLQRLREASVLLAMSVSECWPNVVAEALATGTPVVARDCNYGPREMIVSGRNGFLLRSPEDGAALNEIRGALLDPVCYARLCQAARETATRWSRDRIRALWLAQLSDSHA